MKEVTVRHFSNDLMGSRCIVLACGEFEPHVQSFPFFSLHREQTFSYIKDAMQTSDRQFRSQDSKLDSEENNDIDIGKSLHKQLS